MLKLNILNKILLLELRVLLHFLISFWNGTLELTPASDNWVDTARLEAKIIEAEGNYVETFNDAVESGTIDPQTGFGPMIWDSWETNWTGVDVVESTRRRVIQNGPDTIHRQGPGGRATYRSRANKTSY